VIRRLLACSLVALLATACFGAAATLAVTSDRVAAGSGDPTADCASGTTVAYTYSGADVTSVQVTNLPAACQDGRIWLALLDGTGAKVSEAPSVLATGATATLDVTDVAASQVKKYAIAVVK
jgi:hypothetical protein